MRRPALLVLALLVPLLTLPLPGIAKKKQKKPAELLLVSEGNRMRRIDLDTIGRKDGVLSETWIERASEDPSRGRDVNGMVCAVPDGSGAFVIGEDTGQPSPPPGWGVFAPSGTQIGKLTATYFTTQGEPFGCAFAGEDLLFTTEVGNQGIGGDQLGQLLLWFGPFDAFPGEAGEYPETDAASTNFCKIASDISTAGGVAIDAEGRVYVASASGFRILRFSPPFPTGPDADGGCGGVDALGSPTADLVNREVFAGADGEANLLTFTGLAIGPNGNLYAASVVTGRIAEYDLDGNLVRLVLAPSEALPPIPTGTPQGLAFDGDGNLYYADLDLVGEFPSVGPGDDGKVWRVRFEKGEPQPPEVVIDGLAFPDGLGIVPGDLERKGKVGRRKSESRTFAGGPERLFVAPKAKKLKRKKIDRLRERWSFLTGAIVTSSPAVASLKIDGKRTQIVYFTSWDGHVYAVRLGDGSELWHFFGDPQPGSAFPAASSPHVENVDGREIVLASLGEILYALDAITGEEIWRFTAGTGCVDESGAPPGLCAFDGERNQIETSPIVAEDRVYFGMDVNDSSRGKGGFYAVDLRDGRMEWFFDLQSGDTCVPDPGDEIRRFDGYHDEEQLGLPSGFLATRSGCGFDRATTGCGNVWSSPALDEKRGLIFFGSSNCDTDDDPGTPIPPPPMPPYDEALVALQLDGTPAWRWRPREVDNEDLAFGATPNLFTIKRGKRKLDVVGIGNKDGTYYVLDRDGVNAETGVAWDDADPSSLPYWATNVVPGGPAGGIIGTPAVDTKRGRIHFATAPGFNPLSPQRPTIHALDADTGEIVWQAGREGGEDASFGPTAVANGLVFVGSVTEPNLRIFDAESGALLHQQMLGDRLLFSAIASGPVIVDGIVLVGTGIGTLTGDPENLSDISASFASSLVALCLDGTASCR